METMKLSKEAARAKYLYNKKYQNAYWERRANGHNSHSRQNDPKRATSVSTVWITRMPIST